jgi:hypothetical protein
MFGCFIKNIIGLNQLFVLYYFSLEVIYYYLKSVILWEVTLYSLIEVQRRFGGKYCFHL